MQRRHNHLQPFNSGVLLRHFIHKTTRVLLQRLDVCFQLLDVLHGSVALDLGPEQAARQVTNLQQVQETDGAW